MSDCSIGTPDIQIMARFKRQILVKLKVERKVLEGTIGRVLHENITPAKNMRPAGNPFDCATRQSSIRAGRTTGGTPCAMNSLLAVSWP
jgi:hypothetical protein